MMSLNDKQKEAVQYTEGPLLVLAGAGSGKTTVLVSRVQYIIKQGLAEPWQVLAITFTNKAAAEIKNRLEEAIGNDAKSIWAYTFHSCSAKILRRFADRLGYTSHFTIYDADDQKRIMNQCQKELKIEESHMSAKSIISEISSAKDSLVSVDEYRKTAADDFRKEKIAECYALYQKKLKSNDAMDFDDLIFNTVILLQNNADILSIYQRQFKYIMVDEYQDTSHVQSCMIDLLGKGYGNICVVGDDDQSIYRFRGATVENILNFENTYPGTKLIRLEQNYRSTQNILDAANAVIANNKYRKGKNLWTESAKGEKITLKTLQDESDEATYIAEEILRHKKNGRQFSDIAILYRINAQSRNIELALTKSGIPHKIIGGHRFFDRKEIKDIIAYFALINNPDDNVRFQRIVNVPKRGIGNTTLSAIMRISNGLGISALEVCKRADEFEDISRSQTKLKNFAALIGDLTDVQDKMSLNDLLKKLLEDTKYLEYLDEDRETAEDRRNNIGELSSMFIKYEEEDEDITVADFLEDVSLISDIDSYNESDDSVVLMTLHSAKGLEFPIVFICGMEEGIFPSSQSSYSTEGLEEERRLAYVGITRAKEKLYLTKANQRLLYGFTDRNQASRFIDEIPQDIIENVKEEDIFNEYMKNVLEKSSPNKPFLEGNKKQVTNKKKKHAQTDFKVGDAVQHKTFGKGVVLSKKEMGNDILLEIAFEKVGTKKIMAYYSGLEKAEV